MQRQYLQALLEELADEAEASDDEEVCSASAVLFITIRALETGYIDEFLKKALLFSCSMSEELATAN